MPQKFLSFASRRFAPLTPSESNMLARILPFLVCVYFLSFTLSGKVWSAALPGENSLPGETTAKVALPSEAAIPNATLVVQEDPQLPKLPPEGAIPQAGDEPGDEPGEDDVKPVIDRRPWLRLNLRGHTANIRSIVFADDGNLLCSAGEDKSVQVWEKPPLKPSEFGWLHRRTIRWQIQRGNRGRIYALASSAKRLAMAGEGAMGSLGEILLVNAETGEFEAALIDDKIGHRQTVSALSFSPDGNRLASIDVQGVALIWSRNKDTGRWTAKRLTPPLAQTVDFISVAMAGNLEVIVPFWNEESNLWYLGKFDSTTGKFKETIRGSGQSKVLTLAASRSGKKVVSADDKGELHFFDLTAGTSVSRDIGDAALSVAFRDDEKLLAVGTANLPKNPGKLQLWDVARFATPAKQLEQPFPDHIRGCQFHPDGGELAYAIGNKIRTFKIVEPLKQREIPTPFKAPLRVAFSTLTDDAHRYDIGISTLPAKDGRVFIEQIFDASGVRLRKLKDIPQDSWMLPEWYLGTGASKWSVKSVPDKGEVQHWVYQGERRKWRLPFQDSNQGLPVAQCGIPDAKGNPYAIAIGTNVNNNIYLFRLSDGKLLRQLRGHEAAVSSVGMSRNRRYLVSCSQDGTIRIWNLAGFDGGNDLFNRWGASFEIDAATKSLVAKTVDPAGPLYFRGMRSGDIVAELNWFEAATERSEKRPAEMLAKLGDFPWDLNLLRFTYVRGDKPQPGFQIFPAWNQLSSLLVAPNREWAYWAPEGYYDASFQGNKLFGWQFNPESLDRLPEFVLAAQLRERLEKPKVMQQLLRSGDLESAIKTSQNFLPTEQEYAVTGPYLTKPRITILPPEDGWNIVNGQTELEAEIFVRHGLELAPPKAFANGVVARRAELVRETETSDGTNYLYRWQLNLPSDRQLLVQVIATTDARIPDVKEVVLSQKVLPTKTRRPRLYMVTCGVNQYRRPIQNLDFATNNATQFTQAIQYHSSSKYLTRGISLLDQNVTPGMYRYVAEAFAGKLEQEAGPDDLLVIFLSGHGYRDDKTGKYFYVTAQSNLVDLQTGHYEDCLSFEDFAIFANVPCRKLIILDTCHSGALQELDEGPLKAGMRALQDDVFLTLTASEGNQEAVESSKKQLGRFTARLLEALQGKADADADGVVKLSEAYQYVYTNVVADSKADARGYTQHPTLGPSEITRYIDLPLTQP
jgi:WD40 repeat protein